MLQFRQGDVFFMQVADDEIQAVKDNGKKLRRKGGRIVIAEGETTGHAHAVLDRKVDLVEMFHERYLVAEKPFQIVHEEHGAIEMPQGTFKVVYQREKLPDAIRRVID